VAERILIVEDEQNIASFVKLYLEKAGFAVERVATGRDAIARVQAFAPSLVLLDLNLPDIDGLEVCRRIRAGSDMPILMLTARDDDVDKIVGLEVGADDYVTKPFNPRELVARIKTILRRAGAPAPRPASGALQHGTLRIDPGRRELTVGGAPVQLAPKEFDLLYALMEHRGIVLTRDQLLERVWGYTFAGDTRTVDVHVRQLRRKIGDVCPVVTVWGVGYKVSDDVAVA
jgi:DNA-binding response OmpR family regulator